MVLLVQGTLIGLRLGSDVCIIGAGVSWLGTASQIANTSEHNATVLEAMDAQVK